MRTSTCISEEKKTKLAKSSNLVANAQTNIMVFHHRVTSLIVRIKSDI